MPVCYKNFPVTVGGVNIYANSASLNEDLTIETAESYGIKGSRAVFNTQIPKGSLTIDSYVKESVSPFLALAGDNDQQLAVTFGKYTLPTPAILTSMSINVAVGSPVTLSMTIDYFGTATTGSTPAPASPTHTPLNVEGVTLNGFDQIGGSNNIQSVDFSFSQSYEEHTLLGQVGAAPIIIFSQGTMALDISSPDMTIGLVEEDKSCVIAPKSYSVSLSGCGGLDYGLINMPLGYMQTRSTSIDPSSPPSSSVSIIQYL